jgi:hypothetical protein
LRAPRYFRRPELLAAGVEAVEEYGRIGAERDRLIRCRSCGETWPAPTWPSGRFRIGWWKCPGPGRCNHHATPAPVDNSARTARRAAGRLADRRAVAASLEALAAAAPPAAGDDAPDID